MQHCGLRPKTLATNQASYELPPTGRSDQGYATSLRSDWLGWEQLCCSCNMITREAALMAKSCTMNKARVAATAYGLANSICHCWATIRMPEIDDTCTSRFMSGDMALLAMLPAWSPFLSSDSSIACTCLRRADNKSALPGQQKNHRFGDQSQHRETLIPKPRPTECFSLWTRASTQVKRSCQSALRVSALVPACLSMSDTYQHHRGHV